MAPLPPLDHQTVDQIALTGVPEGLAAHSAKYTKREGENKLLSFVNFYLAFSIRPE
jgi:hypothetical protein